MYVMLILCLSDLSVNIKEQKYPNEGNSFQKRMKDFPKFKGNVVIICKLDQQIWTPDFMQKIRRNKLRSPVVRSHTHERVR